MARHLDTKLFREARNASCSVERVRELIATGADVNRRHKFGNTPLWEAAFHGRVDVAGILLDAGADPAVYADDGSGPLYWAASNGHLAVVEMLLRRGADPNALRDNDLSPLAIAISKGHAEIAVLLVGARAAADHRYYGLTMPEHADWCGQHEIAAMLRRSRRQRFA
jgi:ankyrin repeat protein